MRDWEFWGGKRKQLYAILYVIGQSKQLDWLFSALFQTLDSVGQ